MQMYKLFLNDKSVNFVENKIDFQCNDFTLYLPFQSEYQLFAEFQKLKSSEIINHLYFICGRDVAYVFQKFCSLFTVIEAAGGLIKNNNNEYLFIFRRGWWDLPKGKIDKGETPEQAALREVNEETGISGMTISKSLPQTYHIYYLKEKPILKITHWYEMFYNGNGTLIPQTEEDIIEARWLTHDKIHKIKPLIYSSINELINSYFNYQV